jgi:hypothetical protein
VLELGTTAMIDSCRDFLEVVENKAVLILTTLRCTKAGSDLSMMSLMAAANR